MTYKTAHERAAFSAACDDALLEARIQAAWHLLASHGWSTAILADYKAARLRAGAEL
jgi:hypothetical protein